MVVFFRRTITTRPVLHVSPHFLIGRYPGVSEKGHRRSAVQSAVLDFTLRRQILDRFDRSDHSFDCFEQRSEIRKRLGQEAGGKQFRRFERLEILPVKKAARLAV